MTCIEIKQKNKNQNIHSSFAFKHINFMSAFSTVKIFFKQIQYQKARANQTHPLKLEPSKKTKKNQTPQTQLGTTTSPPKLSQPVQAPQTHPPSFSFSFSFSSSPPPPPPTVLSPKPKLKPKPKPKKA